MAHVDLFDDLGDLFDVVGDGLAPQFGHSIGSQVGPRLASNRPGHQVEHTTRRVQRRVVKSCRMRERWSETMSELPYPTQSKLASTEPVDALVPPALEGHPSPGRRAAVHGLRAVERGPRDVFRWRELPETDKDFR